MTLTHDEYMTFQDMFLRYDGDRPAQAKELHDRLRAEDLILRGFNKKQLSLSEKYKEYIRDADRLSNEKSLEKYGITINDLRSRVSDFKDDLEAGNAQEPDIPRPTRN